MSKTNGKEDGTLNTPKGIGLGPVAREKYEAILQARLGACIAVQEAKFQARRADALKIFLEKNELVSKVATYRASLENLVAFFGEPDWRNPAWLRDDTCLLSNPKVHRGMDAVLRGMKDLKPVFAEIERLRRFQAQVTEKVWLAGVPGEIATLLQEIGEPATDTADA